MPLRPQLFSLTALCMAASGAWAVDYGTVVSSAPVVASVPVVQRDCVAEPVLYQQPNSGAGALVGAVAGAAVGNALGGGAGRAAATALGLVAGAAVGDRVEANANPPVSSTVQRCREVVRYQRRTVGYDVVYDYQGVRRSVRLAQDPGAQIALDLTPSPVGALAQAPQAPTLPPVAYPPQQAQQAAPPVYLTPGDTDYEPAPARVVYDSGPVLVNANPLPYALPYALPYGYPYALPYALPLVYGGGIYGSYRAYGWRGGHGHGRGGYGRHR